MDSWRTAKGVHISRVNKDVLIHHLSDTEMDHGHHGPTWGTLYILLFASPRGKLQLLTTFIYLLFFVVSKYSIMTYLFY